MTSRVGQIWAFGSDTILVLSESECSPSCVTYRVLRICKLVPEFTLEKFYENESNRWIEPRSDKNEAFYRIA